jgi:outer membrane immunogenic protein
VFRRFLTSSVLLASLGGLAVAADLPSRAAPPVFVPPPPVFTWTGFYLGLNGGYGIGRTDQFNFVTDGTAAPHSVGGGFIGGTAGYNYQAGPMVVGVLADSDWASITGSRLCPIATFVCATRGDFLGSVRARVGYAWDRVLIFGSGGLGIGEFKYSVDNTTTGANAQDNVLKAGFVVGGGIEYAVTNNWAIKGEYLFYGFGANTAGPGTLLDPSAVSLRTNVHTIRAGVDYKFDVPPPPAPPIIAKY